jgi:DNA-binding NtrC family response regulator
MARILIVDDDAAIRDTLYEVCEGEHFCHVAETAEKALQFLDTEIYDVVLTDISMPGMSGLELLGHVRQYHPMTPVIVISGISDQEYAQGMIKMGAFDYMLEPFRTEKIGATVSNAIEHRQRLSDEHRK